ncbi:DISARM system helicase DrmA [Polyangium fumosum]|uniref:DNA/RNA helicase n=1 Tax=Polyangium fumosum TaxID=889272 RepID=A0A4U1IUV8_9BACT|nr:DISARM system helicase DrmA [Polyangium fumosum]TKC98159.1 DNA/RNA helicase [Polyangium fumosum]
MTEADVRKRLVEALEADLVGPFVPDAHPQGGQEILPLAPSRWYLTGFLAPQGGRVPDAEDRDSTDDGLAAGSESSAEDAGQDEPEPKRPVRFPASMGLSVFLPPGQGDTIDIDVWYADYDKIEVPIDRTDKKKPGWKRVPHGPIRVPVPLDAALLQSKDGIPVLGSRGLVLRGELRTTEMDGLDPGTRMLSLFLVNERGAVERDRDTQFVFQVRMELVYERGFVSRPNRRGEDGSDEDQRVLALSFREHREWAVGRNTSVEKPVEKDGKVTRLRTTQLPCFEVPQVGHRRIDDATLGMADLAKLDGKGLANALSPLVEEYGKWIEEQRYAPLDRLEGTRDDLMNKADRAKKRIQEGIELLAKNDKALRAFKLANQAMHVAALKADEVREDRRYVNGRQPEWRPFQLAFVLLNLPSLVEANHPDRKIAELIYFPTGGGKTEAYLGLIAFVLLLRRIRGQGSPHEGRGVAVILRYTLRLLTLDQLGRASTLICALEEIRRRNPKELGNARFTIGLWVGASATANRLREVHEALSDYTPGRTDSPFPLTNCPWCGESIKIQNIKLVDAEGKPTKKNFSRAAVYCDKAQCLYTEAKVPGLGLPVLFVDEQIYQEVPSFVVATVDKFAMMPWLGDAGMLFGRATHLDDVRAYGVMHTPTSGARPLPEGLLPPELIVQDELHLISGPLGTMVGLYEAAVDYLCERPTYGAARPPKVICSTATVRRAREQIQALFGRQMCLFPPRGITEGDNFFAKVEHDKPGRLYVGVGAPGRALRAVSVRSYAVLLAAARKHFDPKGDPKQPADPYMTLVGYFNSLRELGGMRRLVEDEVKNRIDDIDDKKRPLLFIGPHPWAADRKLEMPAELTSRENTERVKETKRRLAARRTSTDPEPLDVVLASNMISVGLDIDRLGLMVVTGQPKTTSEYIQATSRVGRAYPGLVVTCLNVMRPRDRSHYERFVSYHESFYREVEATSITPFSGQALDRGLVGSLLSMIRHGIAELAAPTGVMNVHEKRPAAEALLAWMVGRARRHRKFPDDDAETRIAGLVEARGKSFLDAWERVIDEAKKGAATRTYSKNDRAGNEGKTLLFTANDDPPADHHERYFQVPTSMRDVEPNVHVWLRFKQLDERGA